MAQRTCDIQGCDKTHRARGLCGTHYNQMLQPNRHAKTEQPCTVCGTLTVKHHTTQGRSAVCSLECRYVVTYGKPKPEPTIPSRHLVGPIPKCCTIDPRPQPVLRLRFVSATCQWCEVAFIHDLRVNGTAPNYCRSACRKRSGRVRERLSNGRFGISETVRISIYERDDWTCQLCSLAVDRWLDTNHRWSATLDHIRCQSWDRRPDHSPTNLRLAHRMCNSIRGDRA